MIYFLGDVVGQFCRRFLTHRCLHLPIHKTGSADPSTWSWASVGQLSRDSSWGPRRRPRRRPRSLYRRRLVRTSDGATPLRGLRGRCANIATPFFLFPQSLLTFLRHKCLGNFGKAFISFAFDVKPSALVNSGWHKSNNITDTTEEIQSLIYKHYQILGSNFYLNDKTVIFFKLKLNIDLD